MGHVHLTGPRALAVAGAAATMVAAAGATALAVGVPAHPQSHTASLAARGRTSATLEVVTGSRQLTVTVANLGGTAAGTLLRASTPAGARAPELRRAAGGDVLLDAGGGASAVTVTLNEAVSWRLDFAGGTEQTIADLRGGKVSSVSFTAGSDLIALALPRPGTMVPVRLAGGASQFLLSVPGGVPVRVTAAGGAGEVSVHGTAYTGVAGGTAFVTRGWSAGAHGFDVDATAGAAAITVTTPPDPRPSGS